MFVTNRENHIQKKQGAVVDYSAQIRTTDKTAPPAGAEGASTGTNLICDMRRILC